MPALNLIGVLAHPTRHGTAAVASAIVQSLQSHQIRTWVHTDWTVESIAEDVADADMVVAIGGDGVMLRAARACATAQVPVLGVNMGRLGFLTEIDQLEDWPTGLARLLAGEYWIEARMMIDAAIYRNPDQPIYQGVALNDVVISGDGVGKMIQLDLYIDNHWATSYNADGLIVATPTGSTAYALAVGGPILPPDLNNILVLPAAPHLSMDRPIVLSQGSHIAVRLSPHNRHEIVVTADGVTLGMAESQDTIRIQASHRQARFVRLRERNYFYRSLLDRLEPRISRSTTQLETVLRGTTL